MTAETIVPPYYSNGSLEQVRLKMKNRKHLAQTLDRARISRVEFDPTRSEHRAAYLIFMRTGRWVMHFYHEWPHASTVSMAQSKLLTHFLSNPLTEKAAEKLLAKYNLSQPAEVESLSHREKSESTGDSLVELVRLTKVA
jgi:hypothetical protein